jgi:hypothetical protein
MNKLTTAFKRGGVVTVGSNVSFSNYNWHSRRIRFSITKNNELCNPLCRNIYACSIHGGLVAIYIWVMVDLSAIITHQLQKNGFNQRLTQSAPAIQWFRYWIDMPHYSVPAIVWFCIHVADWRVSHARYAIYIYYHDKSLYRLPYHVKLTATE